MLANESINSSLTKLASILNKDIDKNGQHQIDKYSHLVGYQARNMKLIIISVADKDLYITDMARMYGVSNSEMIQIFSTSEEVSQRRSVGLKSGLHVCDKTTFKELLAAGVSLEYRLYFNTKELFNLYTIRQSDCRHNIKLTDRTRQGIKYLEEASEIFKKNPQFKFDPHIKQIDVDKSDLMKSPKANQPYFRRLIKKNINKIVNLDPKSKIEWHVTKIIFHEGKSNFVTINYENGHEEMSSTFGVQKFRNGFMFMKYF